MMQILCPTKNGYETGMLLEKKMHFEQLIVSIQILLANLDENKYFSFSSNIKNNQTVKIWKRYSLFLLHYIEKLYQAWKNKNKNKNSFIFLNAIAYIKHKYKLSYFNCLYVEQDTYVPLFLTNEFCQKHKKLLKEKKIEYYKNKFKKRYFDVIKEIVEKTSKKMGKNEF